MSKYQCPQCKGGQSSVLETLAAVKPIQGRWVAVVRRRRICDTCGHRWATVEMDESDHCTWIPQIAEPPVPLEENRETTRKIFD